MKARKSLYIALSLGAAALVFTGISQWQANARNRTAAVSAATPPAIRPVVGAGRVEPASEEVKIGSELDGKLKTVSAAEGDLVRQGTILAVLENGDYVARVALMKAALREREAVLERLRNGARVEEKSEQEALLREAQAQLATAKAERDRRSILLDRGAISRSEFDISDRDFHTAAARVEAASQRLAVVRTQTRAEDLARAEAEVEEARARLAESQAMLEKTYIRAPMSGRILRRYRKAGESVSSDGNTPVVSMGDLRTLRVRMDVDESDVSRLYLGQPGYVTAETYGDRKFTGKVVQIGQALGRKNVRTDEPTERVDTKILETLIELDPGQELPVGLRVDAYLEPRK